MLRQNAYFIISQGLGGSTVIRKHAIGGTHMFRVAIQVRDLISSNVTSALEAASNPVKMLNKLQREIEEAIIALEGERTRTQQKIRHHEAALTQNEMREADWGDKAKTAMDHGREDLARQALMAREDCRETMANLIQDIDTARAELKEIDAALKDLEAKREETREQVKAHAVADGGCGASEGKPSKAEKALGRIAGLEKRAEFASDGYASERSAANVERELGEMRRQSSVDAELDALRGAAAPAPKKAPRRKK